MLRRFRDDGNAVHLINAGKYVSGVLAVTAGLCLRYVEENDTAMGGALLFLSRGTGRVDDAAVGGRVPLDASFYRELRNRIGLARWECGRLT